MTLGAAGAAGGVGVGLGLFNYNRGNYAMDQKLHYQQYIAGHALAIEQAKQYRQDIGDLTDLTSNRMIKFVEVAGFMATILTALYCPGRLGFHVPAPPGWLMGLFMVNLASCYLWLGLTIWFAMHAALRANTAATHILTRFMRIPVPSQKMLDRARKFLSSYEEQPFREVFRVPFMRHQYEASAEGGFNEGMELDRDTGGRARHGYDVPAWYKTEKTVDNAAPVESMMPYHARGTAPEHFEAYRELQNEWWPFEVYARVCMFLAFMHLTHAWTYQQIGHHLAETRTVFAAGCVVLPVSVLQHILIYIEIIPAEGDFALQHIGPFAQYFAYIAAALEYRPYFDQDAATAGYILVYFAYAFHIIFTLQLINLCSPDYTKPPEPTEAIASAWWPSSWRLPSHFAHSVFLVAPPRHIEPCQTDLVGEMRHVSRGNAKLRGQGWSGVTLDRRDEKRRDVHRALGRQQESPAWFNVKWGLASEVLAWVVLIIGFSIEITNQGTARPSLLSAAGLPNNDRDPRYRPAQPWSAAPSMVGTGGVDAGPFATSNIQRRLSDVGAGGKDMILPGSITKDISETLLDLLPFLEQLASGKPIGHARNGATVRGISSSLVTVNPERLNVRWPAMYQPRMLACGRQEAIAAGQVAITLSHSGRGAIIKNTVDIWTDATPFSLEGIAGLGHLLAAHWDKAGLLLVASSGGMLECPGHPSAGRWRCERIKSASLPITSAGHVFQGAVTLTRLSGGALRAAVSFHGETTVMLFSRSAARNAPWRLIGEVRLLQPAVAAAFTNDAAHLLLTSEDGAVTRMSTTDGRAELVSAALTCQGTCELKASCRLESGGLARLVSVSSGLAADVPVLYLG